jgi:hypothetical protein
MKFLKLTSGLVGCVCAFTVQLANADTITYDISVGNSALSGFSGPYGTVQVNLTDSMHATLTFLSSVVGGNINLFGDGGSVDVNVNASSWALGTITGSNAGTGFTPGPLSDSGSGNVGPFGSFNQTITSFDGFTHSSDKVVFTLTDLLGTWASASQVLTPNSDGNSVAAHIFITSSPADASNGAIVTGFATDGTPSVPDGASTVALLGMAMLGLGSVRGLFSRK